MRSTFSSLDNKMQDATTFSVSKKDFIHIHTIWCKLSLGDSTVLHPTTTRENNVSFHYDAFPHISSQLCSKRECLACDFPFSRGVNLCLHLFSFTYASAFFWWSSQEGDLVDMKLLKQLLHIQIYDVQKGKDSGMKICILEEAELCHAY